MTPKSLSSTPVTVVAENIGGIDHTEVELPPGVGVLTGRNATNRSSFLQAIMAGLGSNRASLKADADEGQVTLTFGGDTYTRRLVRENGTVRFDGDPYLDDPELADLFAFLLENNEARRAVERDDDLREIIMRPIDTAAIERDIERAEQRKRELDEEIDRLETLDEKLPTLVSERTSIENELEETRAELEAVEEDLEAVDADPAESKDRKAELERVFEDLRDKRSAIDDVEFELETERQTVEKLESEHSELEAELGEAEDTPKSSDHLEGQLTELRTRKRSLDETISELQSVIGFNEEMLDGEGFSVELGHDGGSQGEDGSEDGAVTDQLLGETTTCWTCGSEVERQGIEDTLERLRSLRSEKLSEREGITAEIDELQTERQERQQAIQEREQAERRLETVENELEQARDRIEQLEERREQLQEEAETLEAETESFDDTDYSEALELHRDANRLELEVDRLESEREDIKDRIESIESDLEGREDLREERESVQDELADLRTRVDRIEADAIESFNEHIESILDILEYDNIERIWIERRESEVRQGRRKVAQTSFDLHVVRSTDGSAYRDSVDHLSESEREVTGLVFALAGYLVHDVHEELPVMLLDSLEAIDSDRIATVVEYFQEHVEYLVVALLPEDAQALGQEHTRIESI